MTNINRRDFVLAAGATGLALLKAWSERGTQEALPFYKTAPNASPEYVEIEDTGLWSVQSSRGQERLAFPVDRNPETFWSPNFQQEPGDRFAIDMASLDLSKTEGASTLPRHSRNKRVDVPIFGKSSYF